MSCQTCLHEVERRCRRHPPQVADAIWTGESCGRKDQASATVAELQDMRNYVVISAFPSADIPCGEFVQRP